MKKVYYLFMLCALLVACGQVMNDNNANLLLVATKKGLKNVLRILLQNGVDIT